MVCTDVTRIIIRSMLTCRKLNLADLLNENLAFFQLNYLHDSECMSPPYDRRPVITNWVVTLRCHLHSVPYNSKGVVKIVHRRSPHEGKCSECGKYLTTPPACSLQCDKHAWRTLGVERILQSSGLIITYLVKRIVTEEPSLQCIFKQTNKSCFNKKNLALIKRCACMIVWIVVCACTNVRMRASVRLSMRVHSYTG